jgi:hypothetical protein
LEIDPDSAGPPFGRKVSFALALLSAAFCAFILSRTKGPYHDLSGVHTDHLRHAFAARVFFERGFELYLAPFGEVVDGVTFPHPARAWLDVPYAYPPGALILFLPMAAVGSWVTLDSEEFSMLGIAFTLCLSQIAFCLVLLRLRILTLGTGLIAVLAWLQLSRAGLQGFYDPAWIACGIWGMLASDRNRKSSIAWFAAAASLHFRAVVLLPLGLKAVLRFVVGRPREKWPITLLAVSAATVTVCLICFLLVLPSSRGFWGESLPLWASGEPGSVLLVCLSTLCSAGLAFRWRQSWVGWSVLMCAALALIDVRYWWHGSVLLIPLLSVAADGPLRKAEGLRVVLVAWAVLLQALSWGSLPNAVVREMARVLRS